MPDELDGVEVTEEGQGEAQPEAGGTPPEPSKEDQIAARLGSIERGMTENAVLGKILADPDLRAVLEAKQAGKKVKVVSGDEGERRKVEEPKDFTELNQKQLAEYVVSKAEEIAEEKTNSRVAELEQQIAALRANAESGLKEKAEAQVAAAKAKYKDFDLLLEDIKKINAQTPGLSVDDMYVLAKHRKGGSVTLPNRTETESERPTPSGMRGGRAKEKRTVPAGPRGFSQLLAQSLEKLKIPDIEEVGE